MENVKDVNLPNICLQLKMNVYFAIKNSIIVNNVMKINVSNVIKDTT